MLCQVVNISSVLPASLLLLLCHTYGEESNWITPSDCELLVSYSTRGRLPVYPATLPSTSLTSLPELVTCLCQSWLHVSRVPARVGYTTLHVSAGVGYTSLHVFARERLHISRVPARVGYTTLHVSAGVGDTSLWRPARVGCLSLAPLPELVTRVSRLCQSWSHISSHLCQSWLHIFSRLCQSWSHIFSHLCQSWLHIFSRLCQSWLHISSRLCQSWLMSLASLPE